MSLVLLLRFKIEQKVYKYHFKENQLFSFEKYLEFMSLSYFDFLRRIVFLCHPRIHLKKFII